MPDVPTDGDWTSYIITGLVTVLGTMVATVVALAKFIEGKYRSEITDLKANFAEFKAETKVAYDKLFEETVECRKEREELTIKVARLEARTEKLEK